MQQKHHHHHHHHHHHDYYDYYYYYSSPRRAIIEADSSEDIFLPLGDCVDAVFDECQIIVKHT
jgi:hypothetical protein